MKRRILIGTLALTMIMSQITFANPDIDRYRTSLDEVMYEISDMEAEVQKINSEVYTVEDSIEQVSTDINESEKEIKKIEEEIQVISNNIENQSRVISEKAKIAYMNDVSEAEQYLQVLLSSKSIKDFAQRFFTMRDIMESNKNILDDFNKDKEELDNKKESLDNKMKELNDLKNSLEDKHKDLLSKKSIQEEKLNEFKELKSRYENEIREHEARVAQTVQNITQNTSSGTATSNNNSSSSLNQNTSSNGSSNAVQSNSTTSNSIVNTALKYLGVPYVWGGTSPSGFDCSGFVQYVYREVGINLSRTTYTQIAQGYAVSNPQPGDLVFFGSYSSPHHVGIYIGNGQYVHSPSTGDVVKVASLQYRRDYCGARRYI